MGKGSRTKASKGAVPPGKKSNPAMARRKKSLKLPITMAIIVVLIVVAIAASSGASKPVVVDGKVSKTLATVDECAVTTLNLSLPAGSDVVEVADEVFKALQGTAGVGEVTVFEDDPRIVVDYCKSFSDEVAIRAKIEPTGYLAP